MGLDCTRTDQIKGGYEAEELCAFLHVRKIDLYGVRYAVAVAYHDAIESQPSKAELFADALDIIEEWVDGVPF